MRAGLVLALFGGLCACRQPAQASARSTDVDAGDTRSAAPPASVASAPAALAPLPRCTPDPSFPSALAVPEASAAAEVALGRGARELLVVSDSDNHGAAIAYALPDGPGRALSLPLDPRVSDDIEGLAWYRGHVYALASTGYVERFTPDGHGGLTRDGDAYGLGGAPYTSNARFLTGTPPDFEGLCLRPPTAQPPRGARCAGYAASRAYGWLVCLQWDKGRLRVDPDHPRVALDVRRHSLSDCAFGDEGGPAKGVLLVTTNIFGGSTVYRVDEGTGALAPLDLPGTANDEAVAVDHDGRLYQLMDGNTGTSPAVRATCAAWEREPVP